jgi:hypothetical protein
MRVDTPPDFASAAGERIEPVLEVLALCDNTQVVIARMPDGKLRATSKSWDQAKVILPDQVLEVRMGGGRIRVARKQKRRDTATGSGGQAGLRRGCDRRVLCAPDATPLQVHATPSRLGATSLQRDRS